MRGGFVVGDGQKPTGLEVDKTLVQLRGCIKPIHVESEATVDTRMRSQYAFDGEKA